MKNLFDFHFHLLFKHYLTGLQSAENLKKPVKMDGSADLIDNLLGGPFDSQSAPSQVAESKLYAGVAALISVEHAFANRMSSILDRTLPLNKVLIISTRDGRMSYYDELKAQLKFHLEQEAIWLGKDNYKIEFLNREKWSDFDSLNDIEKKLTGGDKRYLAFSIEGGHNLSTVPIHGKAQSLNPELTLKELQDRKDADIFSLNLCHLSYIPEQHLGGFAQGINKSFKKGFKSEDFTPKCGLGLTELGKKVVRQALTHEKKPVLIDVKHMSVYTRFHYYRYRETLINEKPVVANLPVISSHTGFTFTTLSDYLKDKPFTAATEVDEGHRLHYLESRNKNVGRTNDTFNSRLFCNPWTINLFDEEIIEIMRSRGLIGISLDQRVLGAGGAVDSARKDYFEKEYIAQPEWQRMFKEGKLPVAGEALEKLEVIPSRAERHIMLFCLHIVHAVRVGYKNLGWLDNASPWDFICLGSDFDGLINPINGFDNVIKAGSLYEQLRRYLPEADKYLSVNSEVKALRYNLDGSVDTIYLDKMIEAFLYGNGIRFLARFLGNWKLTSSNSALAPEKIVNATTTVTP